MHNVSSSHRNSPATYGDMHGNAHSNIHSQPHGNGAHRDPQNFLAHRPMLRAERTHPAAVCTRCSAFSFTFSAYDQPCERVHQGNVCKGVLTSTLLGQDEWQKCEACDATGWHAGMVCIHCQSLGWVFFRSYQRRN